MSCVITNCDSGGQLRKGLCRAHYMKHRRGTLDLSVRRVNDDDGVRSPSDLPVTPKAVLTDIGTVFSKDKGAMWAAIMPYPSLDGSQPCAQMGTYWFDPDLDEKTLTHEERAARQDACGGCPFLVQCREWAMAHEEFGYWGGMTARQRRSRRTVRRQRLVAPQYAGQVGFEGRFDEREHDREVALQTGTFEPDSQEVDEWLPA